MWWAWCHTQPPPLPVLVCKEPSHLPVLPSRGPDSRQDTTPGREGGVKKRGQEWGLIFACSSIVSGGKKWQHRVQFFSPQSSSGPAREARLTDDSQHLCYAAVTDEGLHITISLFLSVYGTLPLSSHYPYFSYNRKNDRPSMEITLKWPITIILFKVEIFLPLSPQ